MKIVRRGALPVGGDSGLLDIRDRALDLAGHARGRRRGQRRDARHLSGLRRQGPVVRRPGGGQAAARRRSTRRTAWPARCCRPILERLPVDAVRCFFEPDGTFPNHEPNPLLAGEPASSSSPRCTRRAPTSGSPSTATPTAASSWTTRASSCPATSSPRSSPSRCSRRSPAATIIYDVRASWAVRDTVERLGGTPVMNRVGHAFIKLRMREEDAVFAGEVSRPLLLPRLLPGRLGDGPGAAHARARLAGAGRSSPSSCGRSASATSSRARSTRRSPTSR